jgi:hypothetical protein
MSLPPLAAWQPPAADSPLGTGQRTLDLERQLGDMLVPRDWAGDAD